MSNSPTTVKNAHDPTQCIAAKAIILCDNKALVLRQSANMAVDGAGRYHPPGGKVEPGELLHMALHREVAEETGLAIKVGHLLAIEQGRVNIRGEDCQFFWVYYTCELVGDAKIELQTEEAAGFKWVGLDDLPSVDILEPSRSVIWQALCASYRR